MDRQPSVSEMALSEGEHGMGIQKMGQIMAALCNLRAHSIDFLHFSPSLAASATTAYIHVVTSCIFSHNTILATHMWSQFLLLDKTMFGTFLKLILLLFLLSL